MYKQLIAAYDEANSYANDKNKEKVFEYTLLDKDFREIKTGLCTNVQRTYDPCYDCNEMSFVDINTHEIICVQQFYVRMKEEHSND